MRRMPWAAVCVMPCYTRTPVRLGYHDCWRKPDAGQRQLFAEENIHTIDTGILAWYGDGDGGTGGL